VGKVRKLRVPTPVLRARSLRIEDTKSEARLWASLRDRRLGGWRWKRQVPQRPYIVDFYCAAARLVVEIDGGQHAEQMGYEERRTAYLNAKGLRVLRFWNTKCSPVARASASPSSTPAKASRTSDLSPFGERVG
jgi:very-short-patch-repair endonuclease